MKETRLVYSTDPEVNRRCPKCKEVVSECVCVPEVDPATVSYTAVLRLEKKGRGGKSVTVVAKLPPSSRFLEDLARRLKQRCGAGGTFKIEGQEGSIEIQGEKRDAVRKFLESERIPFRG
jgi:translation initiation factor 1